MMRREEDYIPHGIGKKSIISPTKMSRRERSCIPMDTDPITTEYCGIENLGATCYMNSILQALYHLPAFRKLIFEIPLDNDECLERSIIWNLQRLFGLMQTGNRTVSTKLLTHSFGWDDDDISNQQDSQEFMRLVISTIEEKLKGTPLQESIRKLFMGRIQSTIKHDKCVKRSLSEFYDVQLVVKNCASLQESLGRLTENERMEKDNRYFDEETGRYHNAIRSMKFETLPAVLHFQLSRFEYDFCQKKMVKINSKFAFPEEIDMSRYLITVPDEPEIYELYGVLVHAGRASDGHYWAYLRTSRNNDWYEFNDSTVTVSSAQKATVSNFGAGDDPIVGMYSAYMLIYMRKRDLDWLWCDVPNTLIPTTTVTEVTDAGVIESFVHLSLWTEESIVPSSLLFDGNTHLVEVRKTDTLAEMYQKVSKALNIRNLRMWYCTKFGITGTVPCDRRFHVDEKLYSSRLFVEKVSEYDLESHILVFCVFYHPNDASQNPMHYVSYFTIKKNEKICCLSAKIAESLNLPVTSPWIVYLRVAPSELMEIEDTMTPNDIGLTNGAFLVYQLPVMIKDAAPNLTRMVNVAKSKYLTYYDVMPNSIPLTADEYFRASNQTFSVTVTAPNCEQKEIEFPESLGWSMFKGFLVVVVVV